MKAECGVGQVEAELDGKEADYNYNVSCALGTVVHLPLRRNCSMQGL